jgi:RNA polymerase sigma-70 factor (ECF subfamily)
MTSNFATTHWSLVLAASAKDVPDASRALAELCELYWYPLYVFVRKRVDDVHEAQDFTQAFFAKLLEQRQLELADPGRGRFRSFLLTACKRFLINEWHKAHAAKYGLGRRPLSLDFDSGESKFAIVAVDPRTAEQLYDRQWAIALLERVMDRLRSEYAIKDRLPHFEVLRHFLVGARQSGGFVEAARKLGISEATAKVGAHRMRTRYRELLRAEIAHTVERPDEVDDEIRELFAALGGL